MKLAQMRRRFGDDDLEGRQMARPHIGGTTEDVLILVLQAVLIVLAMVAMSLTSTKRVIGSLSSALLCYEMQAESERSSPQPEIELRLSA
nr:MULTISPECIES: hypothetical protein [unclassified Bradyrhizobium]